MTNQIISFVPHEWLQLIAVTCFPIVVAQLFALITAGIVIYVNSRPKYIPPFKVNYDLGNKTKVGKTTVKGYR